MQFEQNQLSENITKNEINGKTIFPNEQWLDATSINLGHKGIDFEIPKKIKNVKIAKSRVTPTKGKQNISENDARTLVKEIRQAKVLADRDASVYILPKMKNAQGRDIPGPDAFVNGALFEFKTITGGIDKVERRFRESRDQGQNVYIRIMNPEITKSDVIRKLYSAINDPNYTGGFKGNIIFSVEQNNNEILHYIKVRNLKK